ncbi:MAG: ROK family protein [Ardenticatenales bacterium]|nr:ROK family protein [Ardenticatenales bacterium]
MKTIYERSQISRVAISRATQLTRPTVSEIVAGLMEQGLVEEIGYAPSSGGKRPMLLRVVDDSRYLIGVDLGRGDFRGAVINLRGEIKHRVELPLHKRRGDAALALAYDLIDALVESAGAPLLGMGIGAPGPVDVVRGVMHHAVNLDWRDIPMRERLQERYNLPVYMANDCQVAALAEHTFGHNGDEEKNLVVINVGYGIGSGIVLDGQLLYGKPLGAGEIGHVVVVQDGEQCSCGNFGCLETVASSRAIIRRAQAAARDNPHSRLNQYAASPDEITLAVICQAMQDGDESARQIVFEAGRYLGIAAANLVGVLGSCRILFAGSVTCFGQFLLDVIREEVGKRSLPLVARDTEISYAGLGPNIVLLGASALLLPSELGLL